MEAFAITLAILAKASDSPIVIVLLPFAVAIDVLLRLALSAVEIAGGVNLTAVVIRLIASLAIATRLQNIKLRGVERHAD